MDRLYTLKHAREKMFDSASDACQALRDMGLNISYRRYLRLEAGAWPAEDEARAIINLFKISLDARLINNETVIGILRLVESLPPSHRPIVEAMVKAGIEKL